MNLKVLFALFLLNYQLEGQEANEFLSIIVPKEIYPGKNVKLFYQTSASSNIELFFKLGDELEYRNRENHQDPQKMEVTLLDSGKKSKPLSIIALKNNQCSTLNFNLTKRISRGYSFIQTDKPIYKPDDEVKIRLIVLDKNLRPYAADRVVIEISDPDENKFEAVQIDEKYNGLYTFKFPLTESAILGDWKITAKVDNRSDLSTSKYFSVQKYVLPLFDIFIETNPTAYFTEAKFPLKFFAKYSFDEFAKGKAVIKFINSENNEILYRDEIEDVKNIIFKEIDFVSHLNLEKSQCNFILNVSVEFHDEYSQTSRVKVEKIQLFPERKISVEIHAENKFEAGKSFHVDVLVKYSGGEVVSGNDIVTLDVNCISSPKHENHLINSKPLAHGLASFDLQIPENVANIKISAKYLDYDAFQDLEGNRASGDRNGGFFNIILIDDKRKLGEKFFTMVKSDQEMNSVLFIIAGRNGIEKSLLKQCRHQRECLVEFEITEDMLPVSNIFAYSFKEGGTVMSNSLKVKFEGISKNFLKTSIRSSTRNSKLEPGKDTIFEIDSKPNSVVGILAFDKSLTFLRKGNDVNKKDVISAMNADSDNPMVVLKSDLVFRQCTNEENDVITSFLLDTRMNLKDEDLELDYENDDLNSEEIDPGNTGKVRKNFPETWIFDTFEMSDDKIFKQYKLPDTVTTWMVSGFSLNSDYGFALADPQELVITQEFFVKMTLPYTIKFGEVLKIDVVTFNYIKSRKDLNVKLKFFYGDFQILELFDPDQCEMFEITSNQNKYVENTFEVEPNTGVTKSFYIKPTGPAKTLSIKVVAFASEFDNSRKRYSDRVEKTLNVIHEGATYYKGKMNTFEFSRNTTNSVKGKLEFDNIIEDSVLIHGSVTGDIVGPSLTVYEEFLALPDGCGAQLLAKFHKTAHLLRYLESTSNSNKETLKKAQNLLIKGLQSMKKYQKGDGTYGLYKNNPTSTWITALSAQVFGDALNYFDNIIKNEKLITDALDYCASKQDQNGFFEVSRYHSDIRYQKNIETEASFRVRYTAFILISFLKNPKFYDRYKTTIDKGLRYIDNKKNFADYFAFSMVAYCYALKGQNQKALNVLNRLKNQANTDENGKFIDWVKTKNIERRFKIIITSYTALTYIKLGDEVNARPLIDWLITQRNAQGDFSENFDTAMGTEAIVEMAKKFPRKTDMNVKVENAIGEKVVDYKITKENALNPYYYEIPKHFSEYQITASGTGKVVVGAFYEFTKSDNVLSDTFDLNVQPMKDELEATIVACVNYKNQENLNEAVIMEFALASGYVYDSHLNDFSGSDIVKNVELKKQKTVVQLHLQGITKESTCVEIKTQRSHVVAKTKKPFVKVYEYMNKDKFSAHFYSLEPLSCI